MYNKRSYDKEQIDLYNYEYYTLMLNIIRIYENNKCHCSSSSLFLCEHLLICGTLFPIMHLLMLPWTQLPELHLSCCNNFFKLSHILWFPLKIHQLLTAVMWNNTCQTFLTAGSAASFRLSSVFIGFLLHPAFFFSSAEQHINNLDKLSKAGRAASCSVFLFYTSSLRFQFAVDLTSLF